jgi:hypothetical protein
VTPKVVHSMGVSLAETRTFVSGVVHLRYER